MTIDPVTVHGITTAHLSGHITVDTEANGGVETTWCFEDTPAGAEQWAITSCGLEPVPVGSTEEITGELTGLEAGKSYEARILYNSTELLTLGRIGALHHRPRPRRPGRLRWKPRRRATRPPTSTARSTPKAATSNRPGTRSRSTG